MNAKKRTWIVILWGALLASGAPIGYILFSFLLNSQEDTSLKDWVISLWQKDNFLLFYLTFPTMIIFGFFSWVNAKFYEKEKAYSHNMEEFLHIIAHDIRSPLNIVRQGVSMLEEGMAGELNDGQKKITSILSRQSKIIQELSEELLELHKMESGQSQIELKEEALCEVLEKAVEEMAFAVEKKSAQIELCLDLDCDLTTKLDPFRMRQVLRNILSNALRYVPEKNGQIRIHATKNEDHHYIKVHNNGPHIPPEKLTKIFNKFEQAQSKDRKTGFGLGLVICKNVVEAHRGKIWAENESDGGVSFHIKFPAA